MRRRLELPALSHQQHPAFTLHSQPQGARGDNEGESLVAADEDNDYNSDDYSPISQILQ